MREEFPLDEHLIRDVLPGVDLLKAGRLDAGYVQLVSAFDWVEFYRKFGGTFRAFRDWLSSE